MKNLLKFYAVVLLVLGSILIATPKAEAIPTTRFEQNISPFLDATYNFGTSALKWLNGWFVNASTTNFQVGALSGSGTKCVQTDNNGLLALASGACGTGTGGGGGSNWTTSTLLIAPTDTTLDIGFGTSASSSKILLRTDGTAILNQSNNVVVKANGRLGIGTATPSEVLNVVGGSYLNGSSTIGTLYVVGSSTLQGLSAGVVKSSATGLLTAGLVNPANLASSDFGDFTCSAGTCTLDATYLTGNQTITLSGDVTGSGATAITTAYNTIVPIAKGGTATSTTPTANKFLVGNGTLYEFNGLSNGTNITVAKLDGNYNIGLSGIVAVANGGTATSTIASDNGLFISNGTNWVNTIFPNCDSSQYLRYTSSTKVFSCITDQNTGGAGSPADGNDPFKWIASGANLYASSTYTKVGINNTTPSSSLHITGDLYVTSSSTISGTSTLQTIKLLGSTVSRCARFDANNNLVAATADCQAGDTTGGAGGGSTFFTSSTPNFIYPTDTLQDIGLGSATASSTFTFLSHDGVITTQKLQAALGAVGTPTYSFNGDLNTGLWSSGADTLNWSTGGIEGMRMTSGQFLGIGTGAPSSTLHVVGTFKVSSTTLMTDGQTTISDLYLGSSVFASDSGQVTWIDMPVTSNSASGTINSYQVKLDGTNLFTVYGKANGEGNIATSTLAVGVGTSTPSAFFDVQNWNQATTTISHGRVGSPACQRYRDSDDGGWTYAVFLDGTVTYSQNTCGTFHD